ncbi:hypothetical protein HAX54_045851 [Datura stramonium]|uniref:Uncharacterized protein n=1 Tax=Datura stramonium TaxID=4076 RepID=A0ABS8WI40_DATST|nr:hypothetical protein [Datura stramonium]
MSPYSYSAVAERTAKLIYSLYFWTADCRVDLQFVLQVVNKAVDAIRNNQNTQSDSDKENLSINGGNEKSDATNAREHSVSSKAIRDFQCDQLAIVIFGQVDEKFGATNAREHSVSSKAIRNFQCDQLAIVIVGKVVDEQGQILNSKPIVNVKQI